jgi:hypothetical protein
MLEDYFAARRFQSPYLKTVERVSALSALWAFWGGPFYYWRKGAPVEASLFGIALATLLLLDANSDFSELSGGLDVGALIWLGLALAAPVLLPGSYRRKGWAEITTDGRRARLEPVLLEPNIRPDS